MNAEALPPDARRELDAIDAALAGRPVEPELTELGRLALALREDRPEPDDAAAARLDARMRAAQQPRRRRAAAFGGRLKLPRLGGWTPALALSALFALVVGGGVLLAARNGSGPSGGGSVTTELAPGSDAAAGAGSPASGDSAAGSSSPSIQAVPKAGRLAVPATGGGSAGGGSTSGAATTAPAPVPVPPAANGGSPRADRRSARKVERSASLTLAAPPDQIDRVGDEIVGVADRLGGFVVSSSVTATDGRGEGSGGDFLLRVPSSRLATALAQLSQIAHVRARQQTAQDITAQHVSAGARLAEARAERRSLLRRLARATTSIEVASLKAQLRDVDSRISQARAELARIDNRAAFSNVAVTLVGDPHAGGAVTHKRSGGGWSPGDAAHDALRVLEVAAGVLLVGAAVLLPLGLLVALVAVAARWSTRRSRNRALDAV